MTRPCDKIEYGKHLYGFSFDPCGKSPGYGTGDILVKAASCDMADRLYVYCLKKRRNRLDIYPCRSKQTFSQSCTQIRLMTCKILLRYRENLSDKGKAVGMHTAGFHRNKYISRFLRFRVYYFFPVHNAYGKACQIVFVLRHKTRVFRSFAPYKSAACLNAALGNSRNDLGYLFGAVFSAGDIIQKEQRLCSAADNVVDAHRNAVDTYGVVLIHNKRYLYFCSHPVCSRNENRLAHTGQIGCEQSAEPAYPRYYTACGSPCNMGLHKLHSLIACGNVYSRFLIAFRKTFHILLPFTSDKMLLSVLT